ncbi:hypothetical protein BN1723_007131, partial [Verticillium longisporum]
KGGTQSPHPSPINFNSESPGRKAKPYQAPDSTYGANSAAESLRRHLTDKDTEASMSERAINRPRSSSLAGAFTRIFSPLSRSNSAKSTTGHPKTWTVYNENVDGAEQGQKSNKER